MGGRHVAAPETAPSDSAEDRFFHRCSCGQVAGRKGTFQARETMKIKQVGLSRVLVLAGAMVGLSVVVTQADRAGLAQPTPEGKKQQAQIGTVEDTKHKGFEGVDFS